MIVVALKFVDADRSLPVLSSADAAALETALAFGDEVTAVSAGPAGADRVLRTALAAGASRAIRVDASSNLRSDGVARAIAPLCERSAWVLCGDASLDRGSGSVPAFLAAELGIGQALGLVALEWLADRDAVRVVRRLDGGRREILVATAPTVLSVEGSIARLRRASLTAELAAQHAPIDVRPGPSGPIERPHAARPYRPRPREVAIPTGDANARIRALTALDGAPSVTETVALEPTAAAARIVDTLRTWGYLDERPR